MVLWRRLTTFLGALPAGAVIWGLALVFCLWALVDLMGLRFSGGLANSTYDTMVRMRFHTPQRDPRIVIVDIDEASLAQMGKEFGRWPWPRDTLATVLDYIEKQQPAAIAWDIVFSDVDRLSPGGDKAFDEAARRSLHSHFSVVRLPSEYDNLSQVTRSKLPKLWDNTQAASVSAGVTPSSVALIAPVLPAVAGSALGYNNGYPDADGVLRRYRFAETLNDTSQIASMALSVARSVAPENATKIIASREYSISENTGFVSKNKGSLMVWMDRANGYPRVPFAQVFTVAEGGKAHSTTPNFTGKIVLIGATASSLHDIHPTPLGPLHAGVDSLATAIDNAVNGHQLAELPRWLQAGLAVLMCLGIAAWVQRYGIASLDAALLLLPGTLLTISYISLNAPGWFAVPVFLDLHLAAGVALLYLALLRIWNGWRRNYWCGNVVVQEAEREETEPLALMAMGHVTDPAADSGLDRLINRLSMHAPQCRVVGGDATATWPTRLRWPELHSTYAVVGPLLAIQTLMHQLHGKAGVQCAMPIVLAAQLPRHAIAQTAHQACAQLSKQLFSRSHV